jgi:hypothetical protein
MPVFYLTHILYLRTILSHCPLYFTAWQINRLIRFYWAIIGVQILQSKQRNVEPHVLMGL